MVRLPQGIEKILDPQLQFHSPEATIERTRRQKQKFVTTEGQPILIMKKHLRLIVMAAIEQRGIGRDGAAQQIPVGTGTADFRLNRGNGIVGQNEIVVFTATHGKKILLVRSTSFDERKDQMHQ